MASVSGTHVEGGLHRRAATGAVFTAGAQAFKVVLQFLSVVVLSRLLSPEHFGLMAMMSPVIAFVLLFGDLGLTQAVVTAKTVSSTQLNTTFWINAMAAGVLTLLLAASAPLIARFYGEPRLTVPLQVLALTILLSALGAQHQALIARGLRFPRLAVIEVTAATAGFAAAVLVALYRPSLWALVTATVTTALVSVAGMWLSSGWRPGLEFRPRAAASFLRFGRGLVGFNATNFLSRNLDNVLIGRFAGAAQLGFYDRAYKLLLFPLGQVNNPIGRVIVPILSRLVDDPERYRRAYLRTLQQLLLFTLPGVVFLLTNAERTITTVLGPQWSATVPIFLWLGFAAIHQPISATTGWLFVSQSRTGEFARWGVLVAITSIMAFMLGLPWGAVGVAAAYALSDLLIRAPIVWWWIGRRGPVRTLDLVSLAWPNVIANGVMAIVQLLIGGVRLSTLPLVDLGLRLILAFAVSWAVLAIFGRGRAALADVVGTGGALLMRRG